MVKLSSVQGRFVLLFSAFFLLVTVSAGLTFWSLETQRQDALIINLAGRQRMLVQQMTREALEIGMGETGLHGASLEEAGWVFDQTLMAMRNGGPAPYLPGQDAALPAARSPALLNQLSEVAAAWQGFHANLQTILTEPPTSSAFQAALLELESASPDLVQKSDAAVRLFESASTQKVARLRWVQAAFLAGALLLLAAGAWFVRGQVLLPLHRLGLAARRIGGGDLSTRVEAGGLDEIRALEENFDRMRARLLASHEEALAWADQLEQRVARRTRELEALYSVSREISSRLGIEDVLRSVTQKTRELLDCDVVFLCTLEEGGGTMVLQATSGPEQAIEKFTSPVYSSVVARVLEGDRALRCDDGACRGYCEIVASAYRASHLAAPLKIEKQIIGALCVGSAQPGRFSDESAAVLTKLANVAAVALQNARLYDQVERLAAAEERQRLAAEMHDGLAQTLSSAKLAVDQAALQVEAGQRFEAVDTLERIHLSLDRAVADTRRAIASLQEQGLPNAPLQEQLARLAKEISAHGIPVYWSSAVPSPVILPRQECEQVLRVAREALLNAQNHSRANQIDLRLSQADAEYVLAVEDDGQGFDPGAPPKDGDRHHFGLSIIQARAARIAGRVEIQTAPGAGTRLLLTWPAREEAL
jgi:two-component system nitrate/nitrite sensor histidine kinase NarX